HQGGPLAVSVVGDAQGRYPFPAARLTPGQYNVTMRAAGYDLSVPTKVTLEAGKNAQADLALRKTRNLSAQLSNTEWLTSLPGTDKQKSFLTGCTGCHTLERIMRSTHDAPEFLAIFDRMAGYYPGSMPIHPQRLKILR